MANDSTTIGYAALQIIPSLDGVSEAIEKGLGGKLLVTGKKGGKQLAKGIGDGLKDLERAVDSASQSYDKLKDRAADALDKITVEEKKLAKARDGGKEDQIAAAEARLNKARRDSTRATRDAEKADKDLHDAQRRLGDHTGDLDGRFSKLSGTMRSVGAVAGGAALAGIAALGAGVAVAGRQLYELGTAFDDLSDSLAVKTGLSGDALDQLSDSVTRLGTTNVPATFGQIGDVAAEVTRNLHLTGTEFDDVTSRLANLKRMGVDVDIRNLGKAFRGFGVDAKDQAPALNSLYEASTKSGLSIDDLTAAVVKGGPALRQLGLDFGESAGLVASFEEAGLDGEKAMAALNKAFAYFSKEGIPVKQGLEDIIGKIQALGDTPAAGELSAKVFGGKGGAAFLEAVQNGTLDLESLRSTLQSTGVDINQVSDDTADWSEKWQTLKNELSVTVKPLASGFFDGVNDKLGELSNWVTTHKGEVIDFFVNIGEVVLSSAQTATSALSGFVSFFQKFDWLILQFSKILPGSDEKRGQEFNDSLKTLADNLDKASQSDVWDDLRKNLRGFGDDAKGSKTSTFEWGKAVEDAGKKADATRSQLGNLRNELNNLPAPPGALDWVPSDGSRSSRGAQTPGGPPSVPSPLGRLGSTVDATSVRKVGSDKGLLPQTIAVKDQLASQFGNVNDIGGWRPPDGYNEHSSGQAIDVMVPNWNTAAGKAEGDQIAAKALQNPNVDYVLWRQTQWNSDGSSSPMSDRGSPTQNHMDHVHVHTRAKAGQQPAEPGSPKSSAPVGGPLGGDTGGGLTYQDIATGGGLSSPTRTPGVDEFGKPGYYEVDPKAVREVRERIDDQNQRIKEADQDAQQAQAAIDSLEADADDAEKAAAIARKDKADYAAKVARRELEDLKGELGEAQKGKFNAGVPGGGPGAGGGGAAGFRTPSSLSGFGSAIGSFFDGQIGSALDVFGVGDSPPWLQGISKFISGIKVSDASGNSVFDGSSIFGGGGGAPKAASPAFGAPPAIEGDGHGSRAGQAPGNTYAPTFNTNDDTAFQQWKRWQDEQTASRLGSK